MKTTSIYWIVAGAVALIIVAASIGRNRDQPLPGDDVAEGGSPLYQIAVAESIKVLQGKKEHIAAADGAVCPNCGKVHGQGSSHPPPAGRGDEPESSYYYCTKCKAYHRRTTPLADGLATPGTGLPEHQPHSPVPPPAH